MMANERAAGILIYRFLDEIQYLMLQASYGEHHWSPPKGHVDPGETDNFKTAVRETEEESGLSPDQYEIISKFPGFVLKYNVKGRPKRVDYWLGKLKNPSTPIKLSEEHQDFKWVNLDQTVALLPYKDLAQAIIDADKFIRENKGCT